MELANIKSHNEVNVVNSLNQTSLMDIKSNNVQSENNVLSNAYSVDFTLTEKRSQLSQNLSIQLNILKTSSLDLNKLQKQDDILNNISKLSNELINNNSIITQNEYDVQVEQLVNTYNQISPSLKLVHNLNDDTSSKSYFDGILGSKPLSPDELLNAVSKQNDIILQNKNIINATIENTKEKAQNMINDEISKTQGSKPFANYDFGKHISDFSSANINSIVGSVALSQANAIPANSPKLLS